MNLTRRNFILKSAAGAAGIISGVNSSALAPSKELIKFFHSADQSSVVDQARKNIKEIRQRNTRILFLDRYGHPLANTEIKIEQLTHQFLFGDNNWQMSAMVRNGMGDTDRLRYYRKRFAELFNSLNTTVYWTERSRNDAAKTEDFQGETRLDDFEESVNWANANGITAKGHPMYWTVPKAIPEWLSRYPYETHMKFAEVRIRNLAARFKNKIKIWDAVNEMLWEPHPKNLSQREWPYWETTGNMVDYIGKVLTWAREEDPNALYTINDYGLSATSFGEKKSHNGKTVNAKIQRKRYLELVNSLGDAGVAPDLMGIQCHTGWLEPAEQMAFYDEMSQPGIPLSITEFWANTDELLNKPHQVVESEEWKSVTGGINLTSANQEELNNMRDQYILNYLTCAFGHPNIHSFYFWGFMDHAISFKNEYDSSHEVQPVFHKVKDLIQKEWMTNIDVSTNEKGIAEFRGFCGEYAAGIKPNGGPSKGYRFHIDKLSDLNSLVIKTVI